MGSTDEAFEHSTVEVNIVPGIPPRHGLDLNPSSFHLFATQSTRSSVAPRTVPFGCAAGASGSSDLEVLVLPADRGRLRGRDHGRGHPARAQRCRGAGVESVGLLQLAGGEQSGGSGGVRPAMAPWVLTQFGLPFGSLKEAKQPKDCINDSDPGGTFEDQLGTSASPTTVIFDAGHPEELQGLGL